MRAEVVRQTEQAINARLSRLAGMTLVTGAAKQAPVVWRELQPSLPELHGTPIVARRKNEDFILLGHLAEFARVSGANAGLAIVMDRMGTRSGIEREVWLRVVAYLIPAENSTLRGPYHAYGWAKSARRFFRRGYQKTDTQLAQEAALQAARQLAHVLETGEEAPFARDGRVAIVPADVPQEIRKRDENSGETLLMAFPSLIRQRDVLLQLDIVPFAEIGDSDDVKDALRALRLTPAEFWDLNGRPVLETVRKFAEKLDADYVLLSRIRHLELAERRVAVKDAGQLREGIERRAEAEVEGAIVRMSDESVIWQDRVLGSTVARTEYVRHEPRLRTEEQTTSDAVRTAYAYLRFSFDSYRRRFER